MAAMRVFIWECLLGLRGIAGGFDVRYALRARMGDSWVHALARAGAAAGCLGAEDSERAVCGWWDGSSVDVKG